MISVLLPLWSRSLKNSLCWSASLVGAVFLASCDFRTLPSAIENVDESAYQVSPGSKGGTVSLRIPVPAEEQLFQEDYLRTEPPPGFLSGVWREELSLVPAPVWSNSHEYWYGWFLLNLYAIHRDSLPDPRSWRNSGLEALYVAATKGKDKYTRYLPPVYGDQVQSQLEGSGTSYDFGFLLREGVRDSFVVGYTLPNGPAHRAGMRRDDRILDVGGRTYAEFLSNLVSSKSDSVAFRIHRPSTRQTLSIAVRSAPLGYPPVWADTLTGGVGYISITSFLSGSGNATDVLFARALDEMLTMRRNKTAWVLDLRDNGGGTIASSLGVAGSLLGPSMPLVRVRERLRRSYYTFQMRTLDTLLYSPKDVFKRLPEGRIVFLQNGGTASASEIVLSALRETLDSSRLRTYGERSFGKGIGQIYEPSPSGGYYAITLMTIDPVTAPRYHGSGIMPDVVVPEGEVLVTALSDILAPTVAGRGTGSLRSLEGAGIVDQWNLRERTNAARVPLKTLEGPGPREVW